MPRYVIVLSDIATMSLPALPVASKPPNSAGRMAAATRRLAVS